MSMIAQQLTELELGQRADRLAERYWPQLSRSRIRQLAKTGRLRFDGQAVNAGYRCRGLGEISLDCPDPKKQPITVLKLDIIYQDEALIVINKPTGVISHARGRYWDEPSIASSLRTRLTQDWGDLERPGLAHRLDRATSGLMVVAKTPADLKIIQKQFAQRTVNKTYRALVAQSAASHNLPPEGLIDRPIARRRGVNNQFIIDPNGKPAQTKWHKRNLKNQTDYLAFDLNPLTGRTHQLRVHLASIGCPIVGDKIYGGPPAARLALHSWKLNFNHPRSKKRLDFEAPLPDWLENGF